MDSRLGTELVIASEIHLQDLVSMRQKALCSKPLLTGGVGYLPNFANGPVQPCPE